MNNNIKSEKSVTTMLVISMGFLVIYLGAHFKWAIYVSLGAGLVGIISGFLSRKIEWLWMKLALVLGYIVPNILLSVVFFVFLFPIALLSRVFKKDPLMLSSKYNTYFVEVNKEMEKNSFEKMW
jgi:hypothetical protein